MVKTSRVLLLMAGAAILALLGAATLAPAQTAARDRITQKIEGSEAAVVTGNVSPLARAEFDRGRVAGDMLIPHAAIVFRLSPAQQRDLDKLLAQQQDPTSPNYRKWLTPEQYAARFGMSQGDLDRVTTWLQSQGFTEIEVSRSHTRVSFSGTAARIEAVFRTEIHNYQVDGETRFANAIEPSVPAAFAGSVLAFRHLDNFRPKPRLRPAAAHFTSSVSGNHFLAPGDFATIYNLTPLYNAGFDGTGITIAVMGQTFINVTRANTFRSLSGLSVNPPQLFLTPATGASQTFATDVDEANLDVEWSGGVAKGATVLFDYAGATGNVFDALTDAIENNRAPVISISYGNCEAMFGTQAAMSLQTLVRQGNSQGQTVSAASGDSGAADCEPSTSTLAKTGLAVDVPGAIPEVTSVGGSEFMGDAAGTLTGTPPNTNAGATTYWAGTTGSKDDISSALSYIPEMAWNDTVPPNGQLSASGGGLSTLFTKPNWQTALTPADNQRDVPDVSLNASNAHDSYLVCSELDQANLQSCSNGFRDSGGNLDLFGGTSVSAQAFGGILAIINQATKSNGLGNANMELYTLASSAPAAFHDITTGSNIVPCQSGTPSTDPIALRCPTVAPFQIGYMAGPGPRYGLVTGLGSIDTNVLVSSWPASTTPDFSLPFPAPVAISAPGSTGSATITVNPVNSFTGTVNLTCALTPANPSAEITCGFTAPTSGSTTSVTINSSSSATATLSVSTKAPSSLSALSRQSRGFGLLGAGGGTLFAGLVMAGAPRRRRFSTLLALVMVAFFAIGMGCGGGGGSSTPPPPTGGTPKGTYTIVVTGTDATGSPSHPTNVTVNVQ